MSFVSRRRAAFWCLACAAGFLACLVVDPAGAASVGDEPLELSDLVIARLARRSRTELLGAVERGLRHRDGALRTAALEAARTFHTHELTPALNELALSLDMPESLAALEALGTGSDPSALAVARDRLSAPSPELRKAALGVLPALPPSTFRQAEPLILLLLRDSEPTVREKAAWAMGHIAGPTGVVALAPLLKDPDAEVRRATVQALGAIGGDEALGQVLATVDDPNASVANMALLVLSRVELGTPNGSVREGGLVRAVRTRMLTLLGESQEALIPAGLEVLLRTVQEPAQLRALRALTRESDGPSPAWLKPILGAASSEELRVLLRACVEADESADCVVGLREFGPSQDAWLVRLAREGRIARTALLGGAGLEGRPLLTELSLELVTSKQAEVQRSALGALLSLPRLEPDALAPLVVALGQAETSKDNRRSVVRLLGRTRGREARGWLTSIRSTLDPTLAELAEVAWIEHTLRYVEDFDDKHACAELTRRSVRFKQVALDAIPTNGPVLGHVGACFVAHWPELDAAARSAFRRFLLEVPMADAQGTSAAASQRLGVSLGKLVEASSGPEQVELVQIAVRLGLSMPMLASLRAPSQLAPEHWRTLSAGLDGEVPASRDPWLAALLLSRRAQPQLKQAESGERSRARLGAETLGARLVLLARAGNPSKNSGEATELGKAACSWLESSEAIDNIFGAETLGRLQKHSICTDRLGQLAQLSPSRWVRRKSLKAAARLRTTFPEAVQLLRVCRIYEPDDWVREACQNDRAGLVSAPASRPSWRRIVVRDERGRTLPMLPFLSFARTDDELPSLFVSTSEGTALVPSDHEAWLPFD